MSDSSPQHDGRLETFHRRDFLAGTALGAVGGAALGWLGWQAADHFFPGEQAEIAPKSDLGMPGKYPGRVVEVSRPGTVLASDFELYQQYGRSRRYHRRDEEAVDRMVQRGMRELVGSDDAVEAWKKFFQPGDRVGIKVVPVGRPDSISSFELVRAIIKGLEKAGVRRRDIMLFERYREELMTCRYHRQLPDGVHWEASSVKYDDAQLELDGQLPRLPRVSHVAGYDRDVYREFAFCMPKPIHDPKDDRRYRSHLSNIITKKVDKFISIPVLKDHRSAGITMSLKNLSHGSVNNVCRSHIMHSRGVTGFTDENHDGRTLNQCHTFIPGVASLPVIREKAVLQIMDGLVGTYEGGPGNWNSTFGTWNYNSLFFATDPVAMDHVGWKILDAERARRGWPSVAKMGLDADGSAKHPVGDRGRTEQLHIRQPQHVPLAATLGLGEFEWSEITHKQVDDVA